MLSLDGGNHNAATTENEKEAEGRFSSELFGWGESLMAVLVFFVVVFTFFVRLIGVDGHAHVPDPARITASCW